VKLGHSAVGSHAQIINSIQQSGADVCLEHRGAGAFANDGIGVIKILKDGEQRTFGRLLALGLSGPGAMNFEFKTE
jgi:hypothetical protein